MQGLVRQNVSYCLILGLGLGSILGTTSPERRSHACHPADHGLSRVLYTGGLTGDGKHVLDFDSAGGLRLRYFCRPEPRSQHHTAGWSRFLK
ncbi:hypothetical protein EDD17DRAFT_992381 [Pisolithus thermaeus]|nr:hypothetical protein EDD17DRAFT_992381 [Pisolithus thermaeus]